VDGNGTQQNIDIDADTRERIGMVSQLPRVLRHGERPDALLQPGHTLADASARSGDDQRSVGD
jgi:hypothetical protein